MKKTIKLIKNRNYENDDKLKILNIGHNDLDQFGCSMVIKEFCTSSLFSALELFRDIRHKGQYKHVEITTLEFSNPGEVDQYVNSEPNINYMSDFDVIFITDISMSKESIQKLDRMSKIRGISMLMVDHHKTALPLVGIADWVNVINDETISATKALRNLLKDTASKRKLIMGMRFPAYLDLIEKISMYDTFTFKTQEKDIRTSVEDLFLFHRALESMNKNISEIQDIFNKMIPKFTNSKFNVSESEYSVLIDYIKQEREDRIDKKMKEVRFGTLSGTVHKVALCIESDRNIVSELGYRVTRKYPEYFIIIINMDKSTVQLRSNGNVDVSLIAKALFGEKAGGHPQASGGPLTTDILNKLLLDYANFKPMEQ